MKKSKIKNQNKNISSGTIELQKSEHTKYLFIWIPQKYVIIFFKKKYVQQTNYFIIVFFSSKPKFIYMYINIWKKKL